MKASLTEDQLLSALTAEQIKDTRFRGVAATQELATALDPIAEEISTACAKVDFYAQGWDVPPALLTGWARDLAAHHVVKRLSKVTEDQIRAYQRALLELEALRDGKFSAANRAIAPTADGGAGKGNRAVLWGSETRI